MEKLSHKYSWLRSYLREQKDNSGIIYCNTRKGVDDLYEKLRIDGFRVSHYHAGLSEEVRQKAQEQFLYDQTQLMVATNAFGMGIDKSNVRFVVHYNMPQNMESYYQEAGRAGRDGLNAQCTLLYSAQDIMTNRFLIEKSQDIGELANAYDKLNQMVDYCHTEGCLRAYMLQYFGEHMEKACRNCGNCQSKVEKRDITVDAQKILSCVKRMGERFGATMVIDVLKGSTSRKVRHFHFEQLSTYGLMKGYGKETLKEMIAFLVAEKYLQLRGDGYPVLALGERAKGVLKGQETVGMRLVISKESEEGVGVEYPLDERLFSRLKTIRHEMAEAAGVPPFMIFSDATLHEMATYYPLTKEELLQINGVGEVKYQKYGERYHQAIADFVTETGIERPMFHPRLKAKRKKIDDLYSIEEAREATHQISYRLYKEGNTLEAIAKKRALSPITIQSHLVKAIEEGEEVVWGDFVTPQEEELIEEAIAKVGKELLKPIKESLPEEISYFAIKIVLAKQKQRVLV